MDRRESFLAAGYMFHVREIPLPMSELMSAISEAMDSPMGTFVIPKARQLSAEGLSMERKALLE